MADLYVAVLAAGKGTRMRSRLPKVLHSAAGLPLIEHVLRTADTLTPRVVVIVVGHQAGQLQEALAKRLGLRFAVQEPQLGTAHALLQTEPVLRALRKAGVHIVALHNHMVGEQPAFYFTHFWGKGKAGDLAAGIKTALDAQKAAPTGKH